MKLSLVFLAFVSHCAIAADAPPTGKTQDPALANKPVLSAAGRRRVRENLKTIDDNIRDLKENLSATQKNLDTIGAELKDLDGLEAEHLQLKKKYESYLEYAEREMKKNEKSTADLDKWEKGIPKAAKTDDKALKEKLETARLERSDRARWKLDAQSKSARVHELLKSLLDNLKDIRSRRAPLHEQQTQWAQRQKQYETMLSEMTSKRADLEEMIKQ